ncbi:MAG: mechanosensitive ion channel family protein [Flammeovirgaceae bacterium]|nr:mechanosensitive ion channel family protein [Flammeovirgaceae bacterium]
MQEFLEKTYLNNTVEGYLIALSIAVGGMLLIRIFRKAILARLKKWSAETETTFDDYLVEGVERFGMPMLNFLVIYSGVRYLHLSEFGEKVLHAAVVVIITFYTIRLISTMIRVLLYSYTGKMENGEEKIKQLNGIILVINIMLWGLGLVFLFDNLGYDVTAIIAGLGVGGIAIALAAQTILGDLFNYFVIFFDRPFEIGDQIIIGDKRGIVEYIGIKTTRLKSLTGEQLIISNTDLTNSRLHNFKRMEMRRSLFTIGVTYQTSSQKLRMIPAMIKEIVESEPKAKFDHANFISFGDFSLNFEVVFFVLDQDYITYVNVQESVNLKIFEAFEKEKIEFAYPTQTLFLNKESN